MSSPSPDPQKNVEHTYQSSEASEHGLLTHHHHISCPSCTTSEKAIVANKTEHHTHSSHHHNIISLSHVGSNTSHIHPINQSVHVHVHSSPKTAPKISTTTTNCTCHLMHQQEDELGVEGLVENGVVGSTNRKLEADDRIEVSNLPPALPPRPPPRPRLDGTLNSRYRQRNSNPSHGGIRKYVFWCCVCGGLATILGTLFLAVYFLLRSYTSTLGYFETIPTFVPAAMLILTGLCVMSLARRKNRYSYLIKVCGLCCLVCALTCVLVTITTTVIHMNRLQTLRECVYTQKTRTCTCYSVLLENHAQGGDDGMRYIFDSTPDCEVIHGALYSCLRAMFGLSVSGILVCIFSCMLVYQLLSHEKKKMYWEQLELRCRSFYQQHSTAAAAATQSSTRGAPTPYCSCCEECRYPPPLPQVYPWERFWAPGRIGNLYSPNPGEPPDISEPRQTGGWSWRRLPWTRSSSAADAPGSGADSQYGFSSGRQEGRAGSYSVLEARAPPPAGGVYVWGPPPPYSNPNSPARRALPSPNRHHHHQHHCEDAAAQAPVGRSSRRARDNYENTAEVEVVVANVNDNGESTDSSGGCVSHTLPVRKVKKKAEMSSVKSTGQGVHRTNVQNVFAAGSKEDVKPEDTKNPDQCRFLPRLQGVENAAFQQQESATAKPEPSESEVYFADVSSCCNISVRNDSSLYDEAVVEKQRLSEDRPPPRLPKDISQSSLCSSVQTPVTESTDDALTPVDCCSSYFPENHFLAPDAQYEVVQEPEPFRPNLASNLTNTISGLNAFGGPNYYTQNKAGYRRNIGTNISALIQNLGGNAAGLLYGEAHSNDDEEVPGGQGCHSDGTMDSGWHSGEEKAEAKKREEGGEQPVNV